MDNERCDVINNNQEIVKNNTLPQFFQVENQLELMAN